jgi:hypothetical protein
MTVSATIAQLILLLILDLLKYSIKILIAVIACVWRQILLVTSSIICFKILYKFDLIF